MSFCFLEAVKAYQNGRINEQEYFGHLTAHLYGTGHKGDDLADETAAEQLRTRSMFAAVFRVFALKNSVISSEDTTYYTHILRQCSTGNLEATRSLLIELESHQLPVPLQALATLAAEKGHAEILEFLLHKGALFDEDAGASARQVVESARREDDNSSKLDANEPESKPSGSCPDCGGPPNSCVRTYTPEKLAEVFSDIDKLW